MLFFFHNSIKIPPVFKIQRPVYAQKRHFRAHWYLLHYNQHCINFHPGFRPLPEKMQHLQDNQAYILIFNQKRQVQISLFQLMNSQKCDPTKFQRFVDPLSCLKWHQKI